MADYIGITEAQSNPFAPLTSELVKQLRDNPLAIAEGAEGAPRVRGSGRSWNILASATVTTSVSSIVFTGLEPHASLVLTTVSGLTNSSEASLIIEISENNGADWRSIFSRGLAADSGRVANAMIYANNTGAHGFARIGPPSGFGGSTIFGEAAADFSAGINALRLRVSSGNFTAGEVAVAGNIREYK